MATKQFILFVCRSDNPSSHWMRIRTTKRTTNPVPYKVAEAKGREWLAAGWRVQVMDVTTQESHELRESAE